MGQSTNAILFYGYAWEDEHELFEDGEKEWQEVLAIKRGHINPWSTFPEALNHYSKKDESDLWVANHRTQIDEWYSVKNNISEEFGVEISSHCSGNCPYPYIYAVKSRVLAYRGDVKEIKPEHLEVKNYKELLAKFVAEFNFELPHLEPKWCLVSDWN